MSLQHETTLKMFVSHCGNLWRHWSDGASAQRPNARANYIAVGVRKMSSFMVPVDVKFKAVSGWGSFNWTRWRLTLNRKYVFQDDIRYGEFVEFCSTMYHETRHAEQFYRIAQGLATGELEFPDASRATVIQRQADSAGGVSARIAQFGGGRAQDKSKIAGATSALDAKTVSKWLSIPQNVADHAVANRDKFGAFCKSARPDWFQRESTLKEVEDWMRATYKKTYAEMDAFAQAVDDDDEAIRPNVYNMYRSLPEEVDAHGIEDKVQEGIYALVGNKHLPRSRRTQWKFA